MKPWTKYLDMKEVHPYLSNVNYYMNVSYAFCWYLSPSNFQYNDEDFHVIFLYSIMRDYGRKVSWGCWYSNTNVTLAKSLFSLLYAFSSMHALFQSFLFHHCRQVIFYQTDYAYFKIMMHHHIWFCLSL